MEPLNQSHHCAKLHACRLCGSRDITFLFFDVTSCDHTVKGTSDLVIEIPSPEVSIVPSLVDKVLVEAEIKRF